MISASRLRAKRVRHESGSSECPLSSSGWSQTDSVVSVLNDQSSYPKRDLELSIIVARVTINLRIY